MQEKYIIVSIKCDYTLYTHLDFKNMCNYAYYNVYLIHVYKIIDENSL